MDRGKRDTILEHLGELRRRLLLSALAVIATTVLSFVFAGHIFEFLLRPAGEGFKPIYINLTEMLTTYFKVSLYSGVALAFPFIVYQLVMFVAPGLTSREKRYLYLLLPGVFLSFAAGVAFGYFVLLPPALRFLLTFGSEIATPQVTVSNYLGVVTGLLFWIGASFELPLIMGFLARIRVLNPNFLARRRRWAIILVFIAAAIITPTFDPVNQSLVAVPLFFLFELGIWLGRLAWRDAPR